MSSSPMQNYTEHPNLTLSNPRPLISARSISVSISLAEPTIILRGFKCDEMDNEASAILRGSMIVRIQKVTKIKKIHLRFVGKSKTEWPEGIPPKRTTFNEERTFWAHVWPFVDAQPDDPYKGLGADQVLAANDQAGSSGHQRPLSPFRLNSDNSGFSNSRGEGLDIFRTISPRNSKGEMKFSIPEFTLFRCNLSGSQEVRVIRAPATDSLEKSNPIARSRNWEDQAHYEIVLSGKSFALGSAVPIYFKFTPLSKVRCQGLKVSLTEDVEFRTSENTGYRLDKNAAILLLHRRFGQRSCEGRSVGGSFPSTPIEFDSRAASSPESDVQLGDNAVQMSNSFLFTDDIGPKEMEFTVRLPHCIGTKRYEEGLHADTTFHDIRIQHIITVVIRVTAQDKDTSGKHRHFNVSVYFPIRILACEAGAFAAGPPAYSISGDTGDAARIEPG
ncbi:hypothetical protein DM02DRAFT_634730 [Periconia macrospinosa]|uniref:Arrestin C-terminal-like domain-containing protein n=1 Tax=Periconia macrospinosa TaxID=97972 RepID=A0A2V1D5D2_9PLEO|nr:hypothetical protein DM02DRAFT_634730 [Periconia macrospinosa]